jgi:hypothetical protein
MHDFQIADIIIAVVSEMAGLKGSKKIRSSNRSPAIVHLRDTCAYLIRMNTQLSFPEIGRLFGGKDHSSIMSAVRREGLRLDRNLQRRDRLSLKEYHASILVKVQVKIAEVLASAIQEKSEISECAKVPVTVSIEER